jgi:rubrerythrin
VSVSFSGNELFDIAIGIERRGVAFYDIMTKSTDSPEARDIFQRLADMEREHMQIFKAMRNEAEKLQPTETYEGEHEAYLQALSESAVFTDDVITSELASQADSDMEAMELAINAEKDSLLFYYEMKEIIPRKVQPAVDRIISEEKSHLTQLTALKKRLSGPV